MFAGEKAIVRIEGSVQQILTVEFLEHHSLKQKRRGLRIAGVRGMKALKAFHCSGIVQVVEVLEGFAHQRVTVQGIGAHR